MANLVHAEKAKRLRDELQQQIDEKNKRKEEEKKERDRLDMKYGGYDGFAAADPTKA